MMLDWDVLQSLLTSCKILKLSFWQAPLPVEHINPGQAVGDDIQWVNMEKCVNFHQNQIIF